MSGQKETPTKRKWARHKNSGRMRDLPEKIPKGVTDLIELNYTIFIKNLIEESVKESDGMVITDNDVNKALKDVLYKFRG